MDIILGQHGIKIVSPVYSSQNERFSSTSYTTSDEPTKESKPFS